ncbi:hypothetical protein [Dyadobacter sp. CY347]|uniref:hypothetical protein n=1 Tax=Dyadobacter sp. CY347 TaxID=2909336 RepID=UPI001F36640E|nr:hypothetical protein [Dyadobacter sp. CY347]MCF2488664.1 hypothetical protein [Dyadobacter sp. CY347]
MGLLDGSKSKQLEYLEQERKELWKRITSIEKSTSELDKKITGTASESAADAAQASRKAAEFRNKTEQRLEEAVALLVKIDSEYESATKLKNDVQRTHDEAVTKKEEVDEIKEEINQTESELREKINILESKISKINAFVAKYPDLASKLEDVDSFISSIEDNLEKSNVSLAAANKRKKDIDDLYREIFGYSETNSSGGITKVEGLRDELESTYGKLSENLEDATEKLETLNTEYLDKYSNFEKTHKQNYESINKEIRSLLPNALTAGLSAAFSTKKENEVEASKELQSNFNRGIYFLMIVSLIPVIISVTFLAQGIDLAEVIRRIPRLVLAIIPMYIPVLWFTISANKKLNLSKRLIEEYAHKEVLSKTYEGLSTQIASIGDKEQSEELRFKLLSNFLQVTSENPGKLISNYETSDHPIMEALEQSYKFQIAIDKLEGVPGLGKVAAILESKSKKRLNSRKEKIEKALSEDVANEDDEDN